MTDIDEKQLVGALARGLGVLDALLERGPLGVTELGKLIGVNKSSAYRLAITLVNAGYASRDEETGKYRLSAKLSRFAAKGADDALFRELARPYLRSLTDATGESTGLCVLSGASGVLIDNCMSDEIITAKLNIGMDEPLNCTSLGKALLMAVSPPERERLIASANLAPMTRKSITDANLLREDIARAVSLGYAVDDEEYSPGMRCVSAPISRPAGAPPASIGVSGPVSRMRGDVIPSIAEAVMRVARELSEAIRKS